jgi:hypothetical protein
MRRAVVVVWLTSLLPIPAGAQSTADSIFLHFRHCTPDVQDFGVTISEEGRPTREEDAVLDEAGKWRLDLRLDAVVPEKTVLKPKIDGFWVEAAKGRSKKGKGYYTFKCTRLETLVVESLPFDPSLSFRYKTNKPPADEPADTNNAEVPVHPYGGISILLGGEDCPYKLPQILVNSLEPGKQNEFVLLDYWAPACAGTAAKVTGLEMRTAAAQLSRARDAEKAKGPSHDFLYLTLKKADP